MKAEIISNFIGFSPWADWVSRQRPPQPAGRELAIT